MKSSKRGFTLIETLISLLLISYSIIFFLNTILFSMQEARKSSVRFKVFQQIEIEKNMLLSLTFDSQELSEGSYTKTEERMVISKKIVDILPELKKIFIKVQFKKFNSKDIFYRSKIIKEVNQ